MSPDLRQARVYVSLLSEGEARVEAMQALEAARGFIRRRLGQTLRLRHTPQIVFDLDTSIEYGARIESLLREVRASAPPPEPGDHDAEEPTKEGEPTENEP